MSTLVRSDGTQFVMQAYRELLSATKKSQIVQEVRLLAEQQGQYVRLFKKAQNQYEAIFSTDPGCLLGESIWHYFGELENLIYCEALPDSAQILVVVVRSGSVYIDAQLLGSSLQSELLPLMTGDLKYRIITAGNVPLRKAESFGTFRFPKNLIESFETLDELLFHRLPSLKSLQLQPLPLALKSEHLNLGLSTPVIILITIAFFLGGWWLFTPKQVNVPLHQSILRKFSNPYMAFYRALAKPAADKQLVEIGDAVNTLYTLPGWTATKLHFSGKDYRIQVIPDGGDMSLVIRWAKEHHYKFHLSSQGVELTYRSQIPSRSKPKTVYSNEQVVTQLVDQLDKLLHHQSVSLGASQRRGNVQETQLTVRLESVSPELLDLVSRELTNLPLELMSVDINLHSGLMSGTIQLSVWGR